MSAQPQRIRLSRAKGWRMPENTVKVDRSTRWGNPFIVGHDGTAIECLYLYTMLTTGLLVVSCKPDCVRRQQAAVEALKAEAAAAFATLRGKNLGCWCRYGAPCHADLLVFIANTPPPRRLDVDAFIARYGWRIVNGRPERLQ